VRAHTPPNIYSRRWYFFICPVGIVSARDPMVVGPTAERGSAASIGVDTISGAIEADN